MTVVNRIQPGDGDPRHGTVNGYTNHACRCLTCVTGDVVEAAKVTRAKLLARPYRPAHGVTRYSTYGCRCGICKEAARESARRYRTAS